MVRFVLLYSTRVVYWSSGAERDCLLSVSRRVHGVKSFAELRVGSDTACDR